MDQATEELIIAVESLKLRVSALEKALTNLKGFRIEEQDGSQQGQIKYSPVPTPIDPAPVEATPNQEEAAV